ncbi:MAG TPA: tetratricopeptide repeat protein [Methylomirabilota bacterium]|nr:tetratricopeptide repeat protein [Methylomirabilota bacterium]
MRLASLLLLLTLTLASCKKAAEPEAQPTATVNPPMVAVASLDPALSTLIENRRGVVTRANTAQAWGELGQAFEAAEFFAEARTCYQRAHELAPGEGKWLYLLALRQLPHEPQLAIKNLQAAAAKATNDAPLLRLAQAMIEHGMLTEAEAPVQQLLSRSPGHPAALVELARLKLAANQPREAAKALPPALTNQFTARPAHLLLSQAVTRMGDTEQANFFARRAAAMPKPFDWPDPYLREIQSLRMDQQSMLDRANAFMTQRRWDDADRVLTQILASSPEHPETLLLLGRLRVQQRRCDEAELFLNRHLTARTNSLQGFVQLGLAHFCQERWRDAAEAFRSATHIKPDFAQAHFNLGIAQSRAGNSPGAIEAFTSALRAQPGDANTHAALAEEFARVGKPREALEQATEALRLDPQQAKALRVRTQLTR